MDRMNAVLEGQTQRLAKLLSESSKSTLENYNQQIAGMLEYLNQNLLIRVQEQSIFGFEAHFIIETRELANHGNNELSESQIANKFKQFYQKALQQIKKRLKLLENAQNSQNTSTVGQNALLTVGTGGTTVAVVGGGLTAAGFTTSGIAAGSIAAGTQSAVIGNVAAGSLFATLQSAGATGLIATTGVVGLAVELVGLGGYALYRGFKSWEKSKQNKQ